MKKKLLVTLVALVALTVTACGGNAALEEKSEKEITSEIESTISTDEQSDMTSSEVNDLESDNTAENSGIEIVDANSLTPVFASDRTALFMLLLNSDNKLLPFLGEDWQDSEKLHCTYRKILSQYYDEENALGASRFAIYKYNDNTIVTVNTEAVGAAGPNKPELKTTVYAYDLSAEYGITVACHSTIIDDYDDFNSSDYTYGFSGRKYYTGVGESIGKQYFECDEQAFKDSIAQFGLQLTDEVIKITVSEEQSSPQSFEAPVIESSLECLMEMTGRNVSYPDKVNDVIEKYGIAEKEE